MELRVQFCIRLDGLLAAYECHFLPQLLTIPSPDIKTKNQKSGWAQDAKTRSWVLAFNNRHLHLHPVLEDEPHIILAMDHSMIGKRVPEVFGKFGHHPFPLPHRLEEQFRLGLAKPSLVNRVFQRCQMPVNLGILF